MRISSLTMVLPALFVCNVAVAQVGGIAAPTPMIGATSPLGLGTGSTVSPTGIPLGATELASPGLSPDPTGVTGTIAVPGSGMTCSTVGTSPSGMFGSTATFDGGGTTIGTMAPATGATSGTLMSSGTAATSEMSATSGMPDTSGMSGMCGSGSMAASSSQTSPITPGGVSRPGIPLGSTEIGNLGVSTAAAVPTMGVLPIAGMAGTAAVPAIPTVSSPPSVSSTTTGTALDPTKETPITSAVR
jgi:hypothetical protein